MAVPEKTENASFSQALCVTDSDGTTCSGNDNSRINNVSVWDSGNKHAVIDLTMLSTSFNDLPDTISQESRKESSCSLIELSDSDGSSPSLKCSTLKSNPCQMNSMTRNRLDKFFDNIPEPMVETSQAQNTSEARQSSRNRFIWDSHDEDKENFLVNETHDSMDSSINISKCEVKAIEEKNISESIDDRWKPRINISAKININIHVSEVSDESAQESEEEINKMDGMTTNQKLYEPPTKLERFIDMDMMNILTDLYGNTWRTSSMLKHCLPTSKKYKSNKVCCSPDKTKVSFLQSLDEKTPLEYCSAETLKYRKKYNTYKDELLIRLYKLYNEAVFKNKLDVPLSWNKKLLNTAGRCFNIKKNGVRACKIELSDKVITSPDRMRCTLIHEMCHAAAWMFDMEKGHGKSWKNWTKRAMRELPELPTITVCHQYEIEYKYTYQCVLCKARYNAHSRSKKTETIRCAYCQGKIELFLNKKNADEETIATPVKPARGFALFVKEKYKDIRNHENNHVNAMKRLGEKFAMLSTEQKSNYL